ncbi:RNA-binding protein|uniref:RNA-binding protein YlmH, contains S4-like domain n=1 Tax=Dendrosporobacter quercicolus TaxID=146817 RepID=A0A1G9M6L8_9FIRM|nr:YlmH/Sll1252 family protein [Dendrosporobacter quercicolus]NSL46938.1 RNA-binding protein [Dendrosporobacter quercicolus DSM 1736]SDL69879.1 RNA-binding protein YlmH, contains S4-like domain [Dendrosporobacter quercicolus]
MSDRDKILRYYRSSGDEHTAARLLDAADGVMRSRKNKVVEFVDPYGYTIAETVAAHYDQIELQASGGYAGAERQRIAFVHRDFRGTTDFMLAALSLAWDARYYHLSHRDVLGAALGLGLKRELLGDIIMLGDRAQLVADAAIVEYMAKNMTQIGAAAVTAVPIPLTEIAPREEKLKELKTTVASLRLDVIAAAGFGVSRSRMADEIAAEKVKVNWQQARSSSQAVKQGDVISMRGRGRVELCEIFGQTKKGRTSILLKRFI